MKDMDCRFCYCPLYSDPNCEGNFTILKNGIKDCSKCNWPHTKAGVEYLVKMFQEDIDKPV